MTMNKLKSKRLLAGILAGCAFGGIALRLAWATPGSGVMTTILTGPVMFDDIHAMSHTPDHTAVINTRGVSDVYIVHNKIAPGGHTGWHSHPGVSFVTVKSGVATEYHGDDPTGTPTDYPAGTGLVEEAGRVHLFANEGDSVLELVAFQLIPFGATRRIDQPAP
jgi:quercetin dioxygenase-like cupin family protein